MFQKTSSGSSGVYNEACRETELSGRHVVPEIKEDLGEKIYNKKINTSGVKLQS